MAARRLLGIGLLLALSVVGWPAASPADPPQVNFQADPRRGEVPLTVHFTDTSNDGDGTLVAFQWDFGDGSGSQEPHPTHTYAAPGKFSVKLTVTDNTGEAAFKEAKDFITVDPPTLVAALLPVSRSVVVGSPATAFATVINAGKITAPAVGVELDPATGPGGGPLPATLTFQTTDSATNLVTGAPGLPVDILPGQSQSYLIALTLTQELPPTDVRFEFEGTNTRPARSVPGLNTLLLSASTTATPDIVAMATTLDANGVLVLSGAPGTGAFSVATANVGASGLLTVSADTGSAVLAVIFLVCRTDPATGQCTSDIATSVPIQLDGGSTATFAVFVAAGAAVPYDPEINRVFVRFIEAGTTRGATSVAIKTP